MVIPCSAFEELVTAFARRHGPAQAAARVRAFLSAAGITLRPLHAEATPTAGLAYAAHLKRRDPAAVECVGCGKRARHECLHCGRVVPWRPHIMTDFLIGAHARHDTGRLLTRDPHLHAKIEGLEILVP